jgi:hypothetical protein
MAINQQKSIFCLLMLFTTNANKVLRERQSHNKMKYTSWFVGREARVRSNQWMSINQSIYVNINYWVEDYLQDLQDWEMMIYFEFNVL